MTIFLTPNIQHPASNPLHPTPFQSSDGENDVQDVHYNERNTGQEDEDVDVMTCDGAKDVTGSSNSSLTLRISSEESVKDAAAIASKETAVVDTAADKVSTGQATLNKYVLKSVKDELLNNTLPTATVYETVAKQTISCTWLSDGTGSVLDINSPSTDTPPCQLYHTHLETELDKNADVCTSRASEDSFMQHTPEVGKLHLVLTNGLFWEGRLITVAPNDEGEEKYTFTFQHRASGKVSFGRRKVYPHLTENKKAMLHMSRSSQEVKRVNRCDFIRKGDVVLLVDGRVGTVYCNNTYTHRVMVYVKLDRFLVCYTQVVAYKRLLENRDWSAKEYELTDEAMNDVAFEPSTPVQQQTSRGRQRKKPDKHTKRSGAKSASRRLVRSSASDNRRARSAGPSITKAVKEEAADDYATPLSRHKKATPPATVPANWNSSDVREAVSDAMKSVTEDVAKAVCAEVGRQVKEALYPVMVAALKVFTSTDNPRRYCHARGVTPEADGSSVRFDSALETNGNSGYESYMRLSQVSPIPLDNEDDAPTVPAVRRSLATDFGRTMACVSPAGKDKEIVKDKLNATHHADNDDLNDDEADLGETNKNSAVFVTPLSPMAPSSVQKRKSSSGASPAAKAVDDALKNLAKVGRPKTPTQKRLTSPSHDTNTKRPRTDSPKTTSQATAKKATPKTDTPKARMTTTSKTPAKKSPTKTPSKSPIMTPTKSATKTPPKSPSKTPKKTKTTKASHRHASKMILRVSPRREKRVTDAVTMLRKRPSAWKYDASSPRLDESTTVSSVLSTSDIEKENADEQQQNAVRELENLAAPAGPTMDDIMVTYGTAGRTRFDSEKIKAALLANPQLMLGARQTGYFYVTAIRMNSGCAVWISEAKKGCMQADAFMKAAGEKAAQRTKGQEFAESLNAYVTGFTNYLYRKLPKPVHFADTFKDPENAVSTLDDVRVAFKEPFGTAFAEGLKYLQNGDTKVEALAFLAARAVMKRVVHRQMGLKWRKGKV